jgi:hypothetical protein
VKRLTAFARFGDGERQGWHGCRDWLVRINLYGDVAEKTEQKKRGYTMI